jgi:MFS family permease
MSGLSLPHGQPVARNKIFYGWVIVAVCTLMLVITYGLMYSYSVFFKPLATYFNWDRETVSLVYSVSLIFRGAISIATGWVADRYGPKKVMVFCGFMIGLGFFLSAHVQTLWQFFLTYAVVESIGLSGAFGIGTAMTSRWFTKNRGLALGIISSGVGLGTLLIVPGAERLIELLNWSQTFIICGVVSGIIIMVSALFLKPAPAAGPPLSHLPPQGEKSPEIIRFSSQVKVDKDRENPSRSSLAEGVKRSQAQRPEQVEKTLLQAIRDPKVIVMMSIFAFLIGCTQLVVVHLVNYATDMGITPLVAATFVSVIGVASIGGRLIIGAGSDRVGLNNTLITCVLLVIASMASLFFVKSLWSFYLFGVIFGLAYGGEVPQIPLFVGKFCGTKAMATVMGLALFVGNIGGALGPWIGGKIFDMTSNYHWAFVAALIVSILALILTLVLNRMMKKQPLNH